MSSDHLILPDLSLDLILSVLSLIDLILSELILNLCVGVEIVLGRSVNGFILLIRVDDLGLLGLADVLGSGDRLALDLGDSVGLRGFLVNHGVLGWEGLGVVNIGVLSLALRNALVRLRLVLIALVKVVGIHL